MPSVKIYNMAGAQVGTMDLDDKVFGCEYNESLIHQAVVTRLANERQGTQSALCQGEVRGGGIKPWRQKGTGRARQGSIRSAQWKGGGMVFPPKPRDYEKKMNVKARREAIRSALSLKVKNGEFIVIDELKVEPKTKAMVKVLENLKADKKVLLLMADGNVAAIRAGANIPFLSMLPAAQVNTYDVMNAAKILVTKDAALKITEVFA